MKWQVSISDPHMPCVTLLPALPWEWPGEHFLIHALALGGWFPTSCSVVQGRGSTCQSCYRDHSPHSAKHGTPNTASPVIQLGKARATMCCSCPSPCVIVTFSCRDASLPLLRVGRTLEAWTRSRPPANKGLIPHSQWVASLQDLLACNRLALPSLQSHDFLLIAFWMIFKFYVSHLN